jgi:hypothetical protein
MKNSTLTAEEFKRRKPVWSAVAELWLDTEITRDLVRHVARVAIASGYDLSQLNDIYLYEVAPVVWLNLLAPAGVWDAFDEAWLHAEARKRAESRSLSLRLWIWSGVGRRLMTYATDEHWREIVKLVQAGSAANRAS